MGSRIGIYPAGRYSVPLLVPFRINGLLAQMVEQVTLNHRVGGSIPSQPTYACLPAPKVGSQPFLMTLKLINGLLKI